MTEQINTGDDGMTEAELDMIKKMAQVCRLGWMQEKAVRQILTEAQYAVFKEIYKAELEADRYKNGAAS